MKYLLLFSSLAGMSIYWPIFDENLLLLLEVSDLIDWYIIFSNQRFSTIGGLEFSKGSTLKYHR